MARPLSISSVQTYLECPRKFKLSYIDRIRPVIQPSYFVFGSAVDKGLNALLEDKGSPLAACDEELKRLVIEQIEFFPIDYDGELLDEATKTVLLGKCRELGFKGDSVDTLVAQLIPRQGELKDSQRKALALCCAASLREKAKLMFDAYRKRVLPLIGRVESVQQEIRWRDANGNEFVGILDLPAEIEGHGSLIADNKTTSRPYESDSVRTSPQLAIYAKVTGKTKAAFFVMEKMIRKNRLKTCSKCGNDGTGKRFKTCDAIVDGDRCGGEWTETIRPEVNIQVIVDDIPQSEMNIVQESMTGVAEAIKAGAFPKNIKACEVRFGAKKSRCPYHQYCRSGDMEGLAKKCTD